MFILFAVSLHKSYIWEKSGSQGMCQNPLSQWGCTILNKQYFQNKNRRNNLISCTLIQIHEN